MTKFVVGDKVQITGGFPIEDGFADFYENVAEVTRYFPGDNDTVEHYEVLVNRTYAFVMPNHLQIIYPPTLPLPATVIQDMNLRKQAYPAPTDEAKEVSMVSPHSKEQGWYRFPIRRIRLWIKFQPRNLYLGFANGNWGLHFSSRGMRLVED